MISPELLRRFQFFGLLNDNELKSVAMISDNVQYEKGATIFEESRPADAFFVLVNGSIDLLYTVIDAYHPENRKEFSVGEINPGEPFGISALIEPFVLTSTARAATPSEVIRIDGVALRAIMNIDAHLGSHLMRQVAKTAIERLHTTRIQLAAAWA